MTKDEIHKLLHSTETSRIKRTVSTSDMDKQLYLCKNSMILISNNFSTLQKAVSENFGKNKYMIIHKNMDNNTISTDLKQAVQTIKTAILQSQSCAVKMVGGTQLSLYFGVGFQVSANSRQGAWGTGTLTRLVSGYAENYLS